MHESRRLQNFFLKSAGILLGMLYLPLPAQANELVLGAPAPPVELVTLNGQHISTHDLLGHTVILTFWATWCEPCQRELPLLSRYASQHANDGLTVLGLSLDAPEDIARVRVVARQFNFPTGLLAQSSAPGYGRIWRIPVSFVIDAQGRLRYNGWQADQAAWTTSSLHQIVDPILHSALIRN
ncbi:MAG: redoxin domain-containing protein [Gammaproteobacteria bacterium]|nr:redoxin domain-containing protein [Gammaproteobacteria bacterium]